MKSFLLILPLCGCIPILPMATKSKLAYVDTIRMSNPTGNEREFQILRMKCLDQVPPHFFGCMAANGYNIDPRGEFYPPMLRANMASQIR